MGTITYKRRKVSGGVMPSSLRLSLKTKWFEMTSPNGKTEDYRDLTPYWYSILCLYDGQKKSKKFWEFAPLNSFDFDTSKVSFKKIEINFLFYQILLMKDFSRISP